MSLLVWFRHLRPLVWRLTGKGLPPHTSYCDCAHPKLLPHTSECVWTPSSGCGLMSSLHCYDAMLFPAIYIYMILLSSIIPPYKGWYQSQRWVYIILMKSCRSSSRSKLVWVRIPRDSRSCGFATAREGEEEEDWPHWPPPGAQHLEKTRLDSRMGNQTHILIPLMWRLAMHRLRV